MDVQTLRNFVREHLDVDDEELPDTLLNIYLQDSFDVTMSLDNRWPRNEQIWTVTKPIDQDWVDPPVDLNHPSIISVMPDSTRIPLINIDHTNAEQMFAPVGVEGVPVYYSVWNDRIWLWPRIALTSAYDLTIRGYRQPVWDNVASTIPDLDPRCHIALAYYAISLAYAQQEDEVLEAVWLARWERTISTHRRAIREPIHARPLVMNGGAPVAGVAPYVVNVPEGA